MMRKSMILAALAALTILLGAAATSNAETYTLDPSRCVVGPARRAALEAEYGAVKRQAIEVCKLGRKVDDWLKRNWWSKSDTPEYKQVKKARYALLNKLHWLKNRMHFIQAEYYGWTGGIAMPYDPEDLRGEKPVTLRGPTLLGAGGKDLHLVPSKPKH